MDRAVADAGRCWNRGARDIGFLFWDNGRVDNERFDRIDAAIAAQGKQLADLGRNLVDLRSELVAERLRAHIERVETSLLTEFHKWASPVEMRVRSHSAAIRALDLEQEAISERITKLEGPAA